MKASLFFFLLFLTFNPQLLNAQSASVERLDKVSISLYEQDRPASMIVRSAAGVDVYGDGKLLMRLAENEPLLVRALKNRIRIRTIERSYGRFKEVLVKSADDTTRYTLQALGAALPPRTYCGAVCFSPNQGRLQSILTVGMEQYISGVVESEIGSRQVSEMYKVQAIIARTYALSHLAKHQADGFNLCDGVHCQAFKGLASSSEILEASISTRDMVVVNADGEMIVAAFHANCGGQTVNSEDAWSAPKSYLRTVACPYCTFSKSYTWRTAIPLSTWAGYIAEKGVMANSESVVRQFSQLSRQVSILLGGKSIPLKTVRNDLGFRSAFFSFKQVADSVIFTGRGYGHGVGLCQDGASEMARRGFPYEQIIPFYYNGCRVVNRKESVMESGSDIQEISAPAEKNEFFGSSTEAND